MVLFEVTPDDGSAAFMDQDTLRGLADLHEASARQRGARALRRRARTRVPERARHRDLCCFVTVAIAVNLHVHERGERMLRPH